MSGAMLPGAKHWDNYWGLEQTKRFTKVSWSKKRIINILDPYVKESKTALDAGCGSGFFSQYFCARGLKTAALDYSQQALDLAKQATDGRARLIKHDLVKDPLSNVTDEKFDIIFTDGLMEHFSFTDQDAIFQNFKSVLSEKGKIVTFVPNRFSPWELIRPFFMPGIEEKPFVLKELLQLNQRNGLQVVARGGINTIPFAFSPDKILGSWFGMLLFTVAIKNG